MRRGENTCISLPLIVVKVTLIKWKGIPHPELFTVSPSDVATPELAEAAIVAPMVLVETVLSGGLLSDKTASVTSSGLIISRISRSRSFLFCSSILPTIPSTSLNYWRQTG